MDNLQGRISTIIERLNGGIHERAETIAVAFLAALSDQNIFLFGPPGTAKSLIARRLSNAFETSSYFEYLMHRFSTPEDVFGPVSITELKQDNFVRKTEGFLPRSDFAFLDEIWKSSPSILNTLLTIINEKLFRNGTEVESAPLKALIAASNETPPPKEGLEALYDRFLVRLHVPPMEQPGNFERMLNAQPTRAELDLPEGLTVRHDEWERWRNESHSVKLSKETLNVIRNIRLAFKEKEEGKKLDVYVSDRRWQRAAILLKASAYFCGRTETNLVDTLLLRHCLWTTNENRTEVVKIVENAVRSCGFETGINLAGIDEEKEELDKEINKELYHSEDVYETENLDGNDYYKCDKTFTDQYNGKRKTTFYIPASKMKSTDEFHPINKQGIELDQFKCCFSGQGTCSISIYNRYSHPTWKQLKNFVPKVLFHKGDRKDVNQRLIYSLKEAVVELGDRIDATIKQIEVQLSQLQGELETPFVPEAIRSIALESVENQLRNMKVRFKDCKRLEDLIPSEEKEATEQKEGQRKYRKQAWARDQENAGRLC